MLPRNETPFKNHLCFNFRRCETEFGPSVEVTVLPPEGEERPFAQGAIDLWLEIVERTFWAEYEEVPEWSEPPTFVGHGCRGVMPDFIFHRSIGALLARPSMSGRKVVVLGDEPADSDEDTDEPIDEDADAATSPEDAASSKKFVAEPDNADHSRPESEARFALSTGPFGPLGPLRWDTHAVFPSGSQLAPTK